MKFTINFTDSTKPVYDLKFTSCDNAVLKDGVWFVDTSADAFSKDNTPANFTFGIAKNDGSKFSEEFYWAQAYGDTYPAAIYSTGTYAAAGTTQIQFASSYTGRSSTLPKNDQTDTAMVTVETEYAIYRGSLKIKYRTNV